MDEKYMLLAISQALKSHEQLPCGAVIVKDNRIISRSFNKQRSIPDATAHAEINAIRIACKKLGTKNLEDCEIYCTCEPCLMCLNAIIWANIKRVIFAVSLVEATKNSPKIIRISSKEFIAKSSGKTSLTGGILYQEALSELYK